MRTKDYRMADFLDRIIAVDESAEATEEATDGVVVLAADSVSV